MDLPHLRRPHNGYASQPVQRERWPCLAAGPILVSRCASPINNLSILNRKAYSLWRSTPRRLTQPTSGRSGRSLSGVVVLSMTIWARKEAQHGWRRREGESAIYVRQVAMADTTGSKFDQRFRPLGSINLDLFDYQGRQEPLLDGGFQCSERKRKNTGQTPRSNTPRRIYVRNE